MVFRLMQSREGCQELLTSKRGSSSASETFSATPKGGLDFIKCKLS